jgi:L-malate glycosyltransferase
VRVLYFSDNSSGHNQRFLHKLASSGHQVWFLDLSADRPSADWLPPGVSWVQAQKPVPGDADANSFDKFVPEFQSLLQSIRPDVVHAGPILNCAYVVAKAGFHPALAMSWGCDLLFHAQRNAEWKYTTQVALRGADGFFCDSGTVRAAAREFASFSAEQIVQFPWGVERGRFGPEGARAAGYEITDETDIIPFLSTRSWEALYDIDVSLKAFRLAYQRNPRLRLFLLGDGSQTPRIKSYIASHNLGGVVLTPGAMPAEEMPKWFRAASGYISCAESDGTSVSLLEAMATGLPVVVTDIPSNREWVTDGEGGWLATLGSPEHFADCMLRVARLKPGHRQAISQRNQHLVAERADWDRNFPLLLDFYERLVKPTAGR